MGKKNSEIEGGILKITTNGARLPLIIPDPAIITDVWSTPRHNKDKVAYSHDGLDLGAAAATPVYCVEDGYVVGAFIDTDPWKNLYGTCVYVYHADKNVTTLYSHLSKLHPDIKPNSGKERGQKISKGQQVGGVGNSGKLAAGFHQHFAIYEGERNANGWNSTTKDPLTFPWT